MDLSEPMSTTDWLVGRLLRVSVPSQQPAARRRAPPGASGPPRSRSGARPRPLARRARGLSKHLQCHATPLASRVFVPAARRVDLEPGRRHGSIRIESRMGLNSATSFRGESGDRSAAIIRRVPSTSRIQNSSLKPGPV